MTFKQPRVPEYRGEGTEAYLRKLTLFLRDFCQEAWVQCRMQEKAVNEIRQQVKKLRMDDIEKE